MQFLTYVGLVFLDLNSLAPENAYKISKSHCVLLRRLVLTAESLFLCFRRESRFDYCFVASSVLWSDVTRLTCE